MINKPAIAFLIALLLPATLSFAQMSDQEVVNYIAESMEKGKTKTQIGNELISKGVTAAQAKRLMEAYKSGSITAAMDVKGGKKSKKLKDEDEEDDKKGPKSGEELKAKQDVLKKGERNFKEHPEDEEDMEEPEDSLRKKPDEEKMKVIFGHDIFSKKYLTFEPNQNMPTPEDYVLGPGDAVRIDVFGMNEDTIEEQINSEGKIVVENVGPIYLAGLTIDQASKKLKKTLSVKYSLDGIEAQSEILLSLSKIRTIQVNVIGEVNMPGTYRLSGFSNVLNAIYYAGGVTPIGSLRNIKLVRSGKTVSVVDIYKFIFEGKVEKIWNLKEGDIVVVPTYESIVEVGEGMKRPMLYEALSGEAIGHIIDYSGGFAATSSRESISVQRRDGVNASVFTVKSGDYSSFGVQDGDVIIPYVNTTEEIFTNKVTLEGYVLRPGIYEIGSEIATVKQLIEHSGGLLDGTFLPRAQLLREKADRTLEMKGVALGAIMEGKAEDILLRRHDKLIVSSLKEIEKKGDVEINGYVTAPGFYEFAEGMTIEDLILMAGGLEEGASSVSVEVGRRILIDESKMAQDTIAKVYTCNIEHDLSSGDAKFELAPNDIVSVRKNPTYLPQRKVLVSGEVNFPGNYIMAVNGERLSDVVKLSGGLTKYAVANCASLKRRISEYERNVRRNMVNLARRGVQMDSLQIEKLKISETYTVGISLDKALANPGCDDDILLQDGDELIVPNLTNTVRVQGEVNYPNAVNYLYGQNLEYYVNQAGGWTTEAKRSKVYVVYMNGKVAVGMGAKVMPGSEIVVPGKPKSRKMTSGEWAAIGTAAASMAASLASVVALVK